ncbi:MAG: hypothetical protein JWM47_2261, partial [Acidimicrobiales bacterium]|nr:hypothetical protein [Acidimicrobiales bacterium]
VLLVLNAKPRFVLLTVNDLDAWTYYPVAVVRLMATKPLVWLIGAWYGHRAVGWAERRSRRGAGLIRWVERHFGRFGWVVVAITSNNVVCLLAGSAGFPLGWFLVLAALSTIVRLWAMRVVGDALSVPIDAVIGYVGDHRPLFIALSVAILTGGLWWQHRAGRSELDTLASLEEAVADDPNADDRLRD